MSEDLGFDIARAAPGAPRDQAQPLFLVRVSDEHAKLWADRSSLAVGCCYLRGSIITIWDRSTALGDQGNDEAP